jgi:hypothetical protein
MLSQIDYLAKKNFLNSNRMDCLLFTTEANEIDGHHQGVI